MFIRCISLFSMVSVVLCSCSTVQSLHYTDDNNPGRGISYYLPMQVARIVVERKRVPPAEHMKAKKEAAEKLAKDAAAATKLKAAEVANLTRVLAELDGKPEAQKEVQHKLNIANAELAALKKAEAQAKGVAATLEAELLAGNFGELMDTVAIQLDPSIPDRRYRFVIDLNHSVLADDEWKIKTTPAGFLSTTDVKTTDRTGDIIVELARLAGTMSGTFGGQTSLLAHQVTKSGAVGDDTPFVANDPFRFERTFDPTADLGGPPLTVSRQACLSQGFSSLALINKCLLALGVNAQIQVARIDADAAGAPAALRSIAKGQRSLPGADNCTDASERSVPCIGGLVYRRPQPYAISVLTCAGQQCSFADHSSAKVIAQTATVAVTNASPLEVMPYDRAAFVTTQNAIEFQDGIPVSVHATQPSELLEAVRIPGRALAGFGEALTQASPITVRYDNRGRDAAQAEAAYYEAQTKALQARLAYEKAQREADALKPEE
jgi:hypothetical protein